MSRTIALTGSGSRFMLIRLVKEWLYGSKSNTLTIICINSRGVHAACRADPTTHQICFGLDPARPLSLSSMQARYWRSTAVICGR